MEKTCRNCQHWRRAEDSLEGQCKISNVQTGEDQTCRLFELIAIPGVGPDAPTIETPGGGKHSDSPYAPHLLPARGVLHVSAVLKEGAKKYARDNWRLIGREDHVSHALTHLLALVGGDKSDDHLGHAACRLLMALETA